MFYEFLEGEPRLQSQRLGLSVLKVALPFYKGSTRSQYS